MSRTFWVFFARGAPAAKNPRSVPVVVIVEFIHHSELISQLATVNLTLSGMKLTTSYASLIISLVSTSVVSIEITLLTAPVMVGDLTRRAIAEIMLTYEVVVSPRIPTVGAVRNWV